MNKEIQIVVKKPGKPAEIRTVEDKLETFQNIVGGYIEHVGGVFNHPIGIYCNEEGKLQGLDPNIPLQGGDILVGPLVVLSTDAFGNNVGLTDTEADHIGKILNGLGAVMDIIFGGAK